MTAAPPGQGLPRRGAPAAETHRGLPRRVRQANLAPQLRGRAQNENGSQPTAPALADTPARTPEENRDLMSALQQGWQRGRLDDLEDPADGPDEWPGARPGATADPKDGEAPR
jgi:hypothetical protein